MPRAPQPRPGRPLPHPSVWDSISPPAAREHAPPYDFGVGSPDASLFPFDSWRRSLARQFRSSRLGGEYGDPAGHPGLRAAIARHVAVSRGVNAAADEVLVTNGAQQAFDLVARVLVQSGTRVAVEDPGYPPARLLFESLGARVAAVPVDAHGLDVASLPGDARVVYVTPSHQFPLGMPMSHARRVALLEWAERRDAVVLEDDYDSEFGLAEGRSPPCRRSIAAAASSTSARSRSRCCRRCAWASWSRRPRSGRRCARRATSPAGTCSGPPRPPSRRSWTRRSSRGDEGLRRLHRCLVATYSGRRALR